MYVICVYIHIYIHKYMYLTVNARWRSRRSRSRAAIHVPNFDTLVPAPELSLVDAKKIILLEIWRQNWIGSDSSRAGTRMSKSGTWTAALERERRLRHLAFTVIYVYIMYIQYIHLYIYMPSISHTVKPTCIYT